MALPPDLFHQRRRSSTIRTGFDCQQCGPAHQTGGRLRYAIRETADANMLKGCCRAVPPEEVTFTVPQPQTSLEMSLAAGGGYWERTSRHHRDTVRAINDGMSAFDAKARRAVVTPEFRSFYPKRTSAPSRINKPSLSDYHTRLRHHALGSGRVLKSTRRRRRPGAIVPRSTRFCRFWSWRSGGRVVIVRSS
jgi:hypothetical protein